MLDLATLGARGTLLRTIRIHVPLLAASKTMWADISAGPALGRYVPLLSTVEAAFCHSSFILEIRRRSTWSSPGIICRDWSHRRCSLYSS